MWAARRAVMWQPTRHVRGDGAIRVKYRGVAGPIEKKTDPVGTAPLVQPFQDDRSTDYGIVYQPTRCGLVCVRKYNM
jgi:hypothetical protein